MESVTIPLSLVYWIVGSVVSLVATGLGMIISAVRLAAQVQQQGEKIAELVKDVKELLKTVPLLDAEVRRMAGEVALLRSAKHSLQRRLQALAPVVAVLARRADVPFDDPGDVEI